LASGHGESFTDSGFGPTHVAEGFNHGLLVEKPELCNMVITEFFIKDPIPTFAPIRRAGPR
jgi:hypothetical protein